MHAGRAKIARVVATSPRRLLPDRGVDARPKILISLIDE